MRRAPPLVWFGLGQIQVLAVKPSSFTALRLWLLCGFGGFAPGFRLAQAAKHQFGPAG